MKKVCTKCKGEKFLEEFHRNKNNIDGRSSICKECNKAYNNTYKSTYQKYLKNMYNRQVSGSKARNLGEVKYTFEEFREYVLNNTNYLELYNNYKASGYLKSKAPSTDRIDRFKPYQFGNIQIITWQENFDKAIYVEKVNNKKHEIIHYTNEGDVIEYSSREEASKVLGISLKHITSSCNYTLNKYPNGIFRYKFPTKNQIKRFSKRLVVLLKHKQLAYGEKSHIKDIRDIKLNTRNNHLIPKRVLRLPSKKSEVHFWVDFWVKVLVK